MAERKKIITAILMALAVMNGVYADMIPVSHLHGGPRPSAQGDDETAHQFVAARPRAGLTIVDLHLPTLAFSPATATAVEPTAETPPPPQLLGPGQSSFDLCLYALMGLGFCKSAPWMKKLSLGGIPDWYYPGGLAPIGHDAGPNCLCSAAVCFVQPDNRTDDFRPQRRIRIIVSSWRKSQFTPAVIASRGPPLS